MQPNTTDSNNINEHLANERTFLAWIRTGIGIMIFGFVTVKFSLFMNQLPATFFQEASIAKSSYSSLIGIVLVLIGALTIVLSYWRYKNTFRQLQNGKYLYTSFLLTILTVIIFLMSIVIIVYLIMTAYPFSF